jgi:hypothetical protein
MEGHPVTGGLRELHREDLGKLYYSEDIIIIRMVNSTTMRWAGHIPHMVEIRNMY